MRGGGRNVDPLIDPAVCPTPVERAAMVHDPWPLHRARADLVDDDLLESVGLPTPRGDPLVHFAPTVMVRIGWPHATAPSS